tara:strand:- start:1343 stop:1756 length:414 start_codon:yes stop_codon:yes gene_type:complete
MSEIKVSVVSSNEEIYSGEARMVYATGSLGELGIAPGHTPLLTGLAPGPVRLETESGEETFFCSGGFIEIQPNEVTFLADTAERADSLDEAEAIKAQELAQKELSDRDADMDFTKAAAQLAEAAARIKTIQKLRKNK